VCKIDQFYVSTKEKKKGDDDSNYIVCPFPSQSAGTRRRWKLGHLAYCLLVILSLKEKKSWDHRPLFSQLEEPRSLGLQGLPPGRPPLVHERPSLDGKANRSPVCSVIRRLRINSEKKTLFSDRNYQDARGSFISIG